MFSIFSAKRRYTDLSWMQVDMHSHILPGLDDGCSDVGESLMLIKRLQALGISEFYFTPHIFQDMFPNTASTAKASFDILCASLPKEVKIAYAAEYMVDSSFDNSLQDTAVELLTLPNKHVLIEMSYIQESLQIEKTVFDLQILGYKPILAHPERYVYYHQQPERITHLRDIGCLLQVNLLSVYGYYGKREQRIARYLMDRGIVDLVGTDVHHDRHLWAIEAGLKKEDIFPYFKKCKLQNESLFATEYA